MHRNVMILCCHFFYSLIHSSFLFFILPCLWFIVYSSPSGSAVTSRANIVESKVSIGACFYVHNVFCNICIFVPWSCVLKSLPSIVFTDFHFSILYPSFFFVLFQIQLFFSVFLLMVFQFYFFFPSLFWYTFCFIFPPMPFSWPFTFFSSLRPLFNSQAFLFQVFFSTTMFTSFKFQLVLDPDCRPLSVS